MKQKNLITVIATHQLAADTIAKAIGANNKCNGYYVGNGYAVTWTSGSLIEASFSPDENFVLSTSMDSRLMFAHNFKFKMRNYDELLGFRKSEHDGRQLDTIKALWEMSRTVVNAMDPDINGDIDFLSLYYFIAIPVEVRRAWLPMLTKEEIRHGVMYGPVDRNAYEKWLEESIFNLIVKETESSLPLKGEIIVEEVSEENVENLAGTKDISVPKIFESGDKNVMKVIKAIPLFNLSSLLLEAAVELGFGHDKTIQTAYVLYSKKLISYPFTVQNTIPSGVWRQMQDHLKALRHNVKFGKRVGNCVPSKCHNFRLGESVYNGFGIVTTGLHPTDLCRDEELLYNLIVVRVIEALATEDNHRLYKGRKCPAVKNTVLITEDYSY